MLIQTYVKINITNRNISYYKNLGYKINESIEVNVKDLPKSCRVLVEVECDICHKKSKLPYYKYLKNIEKYGFYSCKKCSSIKKKMTFQSKYGVNNPMKLDIFKKKGKSTKKEKYGNENYNNIEQYKKTCKEKYGNEYVLQNSEIRDKIKKTCKEKYGNENIGSCKLIIDKRIKYAFNKFKKYYKNKYDLNLISYSHNKEYIIYCDKCNSLYTISYINLKNRLLYKINPCTNCQPINSTSSDKENKLFNFIKENYNGTIIENDRKIIHPYELDIYLPELKLAFEFNGLYWHNELNKSNDYHKMKTDLCLEKDIQLIHVYEDDWLYKNDIIKSMILNKLGKTENIIFARKCQIKEIFDNHLIKEFLNKNHLEGYIESNINIGLYYNNELVSLMIFKDNELIRFCSKLNTNVIGGISKLFKYYIKIYNPVKIITYVNRSYSNGEIFNKLGFIKSDIIEPDYFYVFKRNRENKLKYKLEHEIMLEKKIYRIYDSGKYKFVFKNKK